VNKGPCQLMMSHLFSSGVSLPFCFFVMMSHQARSLNISLLAYLSGKYVIFS